MAVDLNENFESGSNGAAITTSNTVFTTVTGPGTATFDNVSPIHGTYSAKLVNSTNTISLIYALGSSQTTRTMRRLWRFDVMPTVGVNMLIQSVKLGAATATATLRLMSTGLIQMRDGITTVATSATAIGTTTKVRYEWVIDSPNSLQHLYLFYDTNIDGNSPDETLTGTYSGGAFDTDTTGIVSSTANVTWHLDDATSDTTVTTIGPVNPVSTSIFTTTHTVTIG